MSPTEWGDQIGVTYSSWGLTKYFSRVSIVSLSRFKWPENSTRNLFGFATDFCDVILPVETSIHSNSQDSLRGCNDVSVRKIVRTFQLFITTAPCCNSWYLLECSCILFSLAHWSILPKSSRSSFLSPSVWIVLLTLASSANKRIEECFKTLARSSTYRRKKVELGQCLGAHQI